VQAIISLIIGLFKAIFSVSMDNPIEETEEMNDVGNTVFDNPDDAFNDSDW